MYRDTRKVWATAVIISLLALPNSVFGSSEEADFVAKIEMMKGHLIQAIANKDLGNSGFAKAHAAHPIAEIYILIKSELEEKDSMQAQKLEAALNKLVTDVDTLSIEQFKGEVKNVEEMLDDAVNIMVSESNRDDPKFWMIVAIKLIEEMEHEYEEAISPEGELKEMIEYQDAQGFMLRADAIFTSIADSIDENEREELSGFFTSLKKAIEEKQPPQRIELIANGIMGEFGELAGVELESEEKPSIAKIKMLLSKLLEEYKQGEYEEAEEIAIEAYLANYEFLEAEIEEKDEALKESTEIMLREELRGMIKERAPIEDVERKIEEINVNLDKILALGIGGEDPRLVYVKNIRMLLKKVIENVEESDYEEAKKNALRAYLDNYEFIERDVDSYSEELNENVEMLLKDELVRQLENKASIEEIKDTVEEINVKLDRVEAVVPEFPAGLIIVIASVTALVIAASRVGLLKNKLQFLL